MRKMQEKRRNTIMKLLSFVAVFLSLYLPAIILRTLLFKESGGMLGFGYGILLVSAGFYAGSAIMAEKWRFPDRLAENKAIQFIFSNNGPQAQLRTIITYITMLAPLACTIALFSGKGTLRSLFEIFFALLFYLIGIRAVINDFEQILSESRMYFGIFLIAVSFFVSYYDKYCNFLQPYVFASAYAFMIIALIVKNQGSLEYNIFLKKSIDKTGVPKNIRRYNISAVVVLSLIIVLLFNLKKIVLYLLKLIVKIIAIVMLLFLKLVSLLMPGGEQAEKNTGDGKTPELPKITGSGNKILDYIAIAFIITIVLFILYKISPFIFRKIQTFVLFIVSKIKAYFKLRVPAEIMASEEYTDEIEILKPDSIGKGHTKRRKIARNIKKYLKGVTDPVEKVRFLYGTVINAMLSCKINIAPADTTREILEKSKKIDGIYYPFGKMTIAYEETRYDDAKIDNSKIEEYENEFGKVLEHMNIDW
jgi:hypothetical protein